MYILMYNGYLYMSNVWYMLYESRLAIRAGNSLTPYLTYVIMQVVNTNFRVNPKTLQRNAISTTMPSIKTFVYICIQLDAYE